MLDNGGDSVVLVSTIPSPFIVADELASRDLAADDCSEITSTVADDATTSPTSASPPIDHVTGQTTDDVSRKEPANVKSAAMTSSDVTSAAMTSSAEVTRAGQTGRHKKSLEMVVNLLKRPSTTTTTASAVTQSAALTSGHVVLNGGRCSTADNDLIRQSLLQRVVTAPSPAYGPLPATTWSHFRFRSVAPPPIRQLKQMCKNVRSFVPSAQRRAAVPPWRTPAAMDLLFSAVPVTRHRAAAMHFPQPRVSAYRPPRFHTAHLSTAVSRDRRPRDDGELSLLSLLLEASGTSCRPSTSSLTSSSTSHPPPTAQPWKAAIN